MRRGGHRQDRAGPGAHAVHRGDHRLRAVAHRLDHIARHARELEQAGQVALGERTDDLVHVAARAEVATGSGDHDGADVGRRVQRAEEVAQLRIGGEGQRILALRAVERDDTDALRQLEAEVGRLKR